MTDSAKLLLNLPRSICRHRSWTFCGPRIFKSLHFTVTLMVPLLCGTGGVGGVWISGTAALAG